MSAEMYVLAMSVGPVGVSDDLGTLKRRAEAKEKALSDATEFKWGSDRYVGWTERLLLHYVSKRSGRWNRSSYFIDTVKVIDPDQDA